MKTNVKEAAAHQVRMDRIQTVSGMFRLLIWISLALGGYCLLAFFFGWSAPFADKIRIVASPGHVYTSPGEMPKAILALVMVRTALAVFGALVLNSLLRLYQQGIIFSAKNVGYIRFLGWYLMIDWLVNYQLQSIAGDMALSTTPLLVGFLVIFVAWIMDEGRKLQEEQALTV